MMKECGNCKILCEQAGDLRRDASIEYTDPTPGSQGGVFPYSFHCAEIGFSCTEASSDPSCNSTRSGNQIAK